MTDPDAPDLSLPDFSGKVVVFYLADPPHAIENGIVLQYPEFRHFGGALFVVGRGPAAVGDDWNTPCGVAWSAVLSYLVFASREEFEKRMNQVSRSLLSRLFGS